MRLGRVKSPVFPTTRKISRLIVAVAILDCILMKHAYTARNDGEWAVPCFKVTVFTDVPLYPFVRFAGPQISNLNSFFSLDVPFLKA